MKKLICLILSLVLAAAMLTACGGNDQPAGTEDNGNSSASESQTETAPEYNEDDFVTESLGDGKCKLTAYYGDSAVVVIPDTIRDETVTEIAGVGTAGIEKVVLPDTVEVIGTQAFNYCPDLKEIVFGNGLKEVGYYAFNACDSLTEIIFPESLAKLGDMPFGICTNLKEVYIPASVTEFDGMLYYAETMPDLVIVTPAGSDAEKKAKEDGLNVKNQ